MFSATKRIVSLARGAKTLSTHAEPPRVKLAKNLLIFNQVVSSKDEASLTAAAQYSPVVDLKALPVELSFFKRYLSSSSSASTEPFIPDPKAWQNFPAFEFVVAEASRRETWPFLVSAL